MNEDFVTFELAKKLKEKGFRAPCGYVYNYKRKELEYKKESTIWNNSEYWFAAPTISQVLKWLREKDIILAINPSYFKGDCCFGWDCDIWANANYNHRCVSDNSYEAAALAGIEYVIDNLI